MNPSAYLEAIGDLADAFDQRALAAFRKVGTEIKADGTPVTHLDRDVTELVQSALRERFPGHGIVSEENPEDYLPGAEWQWVVDPLDGTAMFARGFPIWCLGIGLMRGAEPVAGCLSFPAIGERYTCDEGRIRVNGRPPPPIDPAPARPTRSVLVGSDIIQEFPLQRIHGYKLRNFGTNLYHLAAVALGHAEAMISPRSYVWDLIPALPFTRARGLVERYLDGTPFRLEPLWGAGRRHAALAQPLIVGEGRVVDEVLEMMG